MSRLLGNFLFWSAEVDSTQDMVLELESDGLSPGILWGADLQKKGRGRRGRTWVSPEGGLYFSFLIPLGILPLEIYGFLLPVALIESINKLLSEKNQVHIRWPNDLVWRGKKLAGVLLEKKGEWIVSGVGVNVEATPSVMNRPVISLRDIGWKGNKWEVLSLFIDELNLWVERSPEEIIDRYRGWVEGIPGRWRVQTQEGERMVFIRNITDTGMIETDAGVFSYLELIDIEANHG